MPTKHTILATALLLTTLPLFAQDSIVDKVERSTAKAAEKTKEAAEEVGDKTKDAARAIGHKSREVWRKAKASMSEDRGTYRQGAREKLDDLDSQLAVLKSRKAEAADPRAFGQTLDTLSEQRDTAEHELAQLDTATNKEDYASDRRRLNDTVNTLEDNLADARKQLP